MSGQLVPLDLIHRGVGGQQFVILHTKYTHTHTHYLCMTAQGHFVTDIADVVISWSRSGQIEAMD